MWDFWTWSKIRSNFVRGVNIISLRAAPCETLSEDWVSENELLSGGGGGGSKVVVSVGNSLRQGHLHHHLLESNIGGTVAAHGSDNWYEPAVPTHRQTHYTPPLIDWHLREDDDLCNRW